MNFFSTQKDSENSENSDSYSDIDLESNTSKNSNENTIVNLLENLENTRGPGIFGRVCNSISNKIGNTYNGTKLGIYNVYTNFRDRELNSDEKLRSRADRLGIKSHELVQINHQRHLRLANYVKLTALIGYLTLGTIILTGNSHINESPQRVNIYRSFPLSTLHVSSDFRRMN